MTVLLSEQSRGETENVVYPEVLEAVQAVAAREEDGFGSEADFLQVLEAMRVKNSLIMHTLAKDIQIVKISSLPASSPATGSPRDRHRT